MSIPCHDARRLDWPGCPNTRDLGGLPTVGGGRTRRGAVVRSDSPHRLAEAGQKALLAHGVRTIVDLRLPDEAASGRYPFAEPGDHGITYQNLSFISPSAAGSDASESAEPLRLADDYKRMLERFSGQVVAITRAIARAAPGGVLIHCHAGRDRTGLISALLLDLVGVPREIIAEDYALSSENLRERTEEWLSSNPAKRAEWEEDVRRYWTRPEVMREVLTYLDERFGGAEGYLRQAGLGDDEITVLRARLLAPDPLPPPGLAPHSPV